jgi:hypothetical protein
MAVTVFTKNRDRLFGGEVAGKFFAAVLDHASVEGLLSDDHSPGRQHADPGVGEPEELLGQGGSGEPPGPGRNGERHFKG